MRVQACEHARVPVSPAWRRWWLDANRRAGLEALLGIGPGALVECTPPSAARVGARWCRDGARASFGMIPVSDGTQLVVELVARRWRAPRPAVLRAALLQVAFWLEAG